jgi:hypothetical protein
MPRRRARNRGCPRKLRAVLGFPRRRLGAQSARPGQPIVSGTLWAAGCVCETDWRQLGRIEKVLRA